MAREDLVRLVFTVAACAALACLGTCLRREGSHRVTLLQYAPSVEDNFRNAGLLTLQDNWEQRGGGLTRRAADLDVFPTRFGEPTDVAAKSKTQQLAKVADSGQEIVGDAARVDQTGQGELIWTSDGTPVQPTPWHIQFGGGGSPDWIVRSRQEQLAEPRRTSAGGDEVTTFSDEEEDKIASAISRWIETASGGKKMGEDGNVGEAEAERPSGKRSLSHRSMKKRHASRGSDPQQKHMWQPWATKTDDLKARAAGKLWKKVWELQRKNLKNMARMCPMCSAIPGPTELKRIFCEACKQFPTTWVRSCFRPTGTS
jgi:RNase P subunit RPR2